MEVVKPVTWQTQNALSFRGQKDFNWNSFVCHSTELVILYKNAQIKGGLLTFYERSRYFGQKIICIPIDWNYNIHVHFIPISIFSFFLEGFRFCGFAHEHMVSKNSFPTKSIWGQRWGSGATEAEPHGQRRPQVYISVKRGHSVGLHGQFHKGPLCGATPQ